MTTSASPIRRISSASWSAPRSVCTVTSPSFRSRGSAEEPVKAAGKSSGTTILRLIGEAPFGSSGGRSAATAKPAAARLTPRPGAFEPGPSPGSGRRPSAEAAGIEQREIHGRPAVDDPLGDQAAGGGRVLEAVPPPADGQEEALDARRPADDRVVVRRERAGDRPSPRRCAPARSPGTRWMAFVTASSIMPQSTGAAWSSPMSSTSPGLRGSCCHLLAEVEPAPGVRRDRHGSGHVRERLRVEDVPPPRVDREGTPARRPTRAAAGPAALMTTGAAIVAVGRPDAADAAPVHGRAPSSRRPRGCGRRAREPAGRSRPSPRPAPRRRLAAPTRRRPDRRRGAPARWPGPPWA